MAYGDDIDNLGADHRWDFDGNSNDAIGSANGTDTTMAYTGAALTEDATNSALMNQRSDRITLPTTTTINNSAQERKAVGGWFMVDDVELPTCNIYREGDATTYWQFVIFPGNSLMLEVRDGATWQLQVYSDIALEANRVYHIIGIFEGNNYGNELRFYIDGVEQTAAVPSDRQPDDASLASRGVGYFGDPASGGINGVTFVLDSPGDNRTAEQVINAYYQHWAAWGDSADAVLTETEIRETLFERGALAEHTVSTDTEANMQTALDAITTSQINAALNIEIEAVTGGGDFTLDLDGHNFPDLASMNVRYNGTADTLTLRNTNGANAVSSKCNAPFGGTINVVTEVNITITVLDASDNSVVSGARVQLDADSGGPLSAGTEILAGTTNGSGVITTTFDYSANQPVIGVVRQGTSSTYYKQGNISGSITDIGLSLTILVVPDE